MTVAELSESFPAFVGALVARDTALLDIDLEVTLEQHLQTCFLAMETAQTEAYADTSRLAEVTRHLLADIVHLKPLTTGAATSSLNFLQLSVSLSALGQCLSTGQLARAGDWIVSSLNDELAFGDTIAHLNADLNRLDDFISSGQSFIKQNWPSLLCQWYAAVYMFCNRTSTFPEFAYQLFPYALVAIEAGFANGAEPAVDAFSRLTEWAGANDADIAKQLGRRLEELYADGSGPLATQLAHVLLTGAAHGTTRSPREWAKLIRERHWANAGVATRLRVLVSFASGDSGFGTYKDELLTTILEFQDSAQSASTFDREQWREATFVTIYPVVNALLRADKVSDLVELLGAWYGVDRPDQLKELVFIAPFMKADTVWASSGRLLTFDHAPALPFDATTVTNLALRVAIGHQGHTGLEAPHDQSRRGIPDFEKGADFERTLTELLALRSLPYAAFEDSAAAVPFILNPIPFQALCARTLARSWPISTSLRKPMQDRQVVRVGIWIHPLLHGELERDVTSKLFTNAGIDCVAESSGHDDDRERFLRLYARSDLDIFWVIGHAERRAFAPEESNLNVLANGVLTLRDLVDAPLPAPDGRRRLLVLNVCGIGGSASYGGIGRIGIAAMLAAPQQATVAHLWLTHSIAALTFGIFLAQSLSQRMSYFAAFENSLRATNSKKEAVIDGLRRIGGADEAAAIVERSPLDTANILFSGSPIFLQ